ncbi:MAG TPA: NAD-dependent epimerase/dehydratase family protein [Candidatus Acidoferrales bacterium]|nr:NAD-dependent epimerase/dehydratase family protein [Candidatus Acidoferrales bacterium]
MSRVTVVGARGFIGGAVAAAARRRGDEVLEASHGDVETGRDLGTVIYCSGIAWGASEAPLEAYDAHVVAVARLLRDARYDRFVYLSSTRVYDASPATDEETPAAVRADAAADVYVASKLAGENLVLAANPANRVVRASNTFGASLRSQLFLSDVLRQAVTTGRIQLRSALESSKDYVSVEDVAERTLDVASRGTHRIYNVAAGRNTTHRALIDAIRRVLPVDVEIAPGSPATTAQPIDVARVQAEFPFVPAEVCAEVPRLLQAFARERHRS